MSQHSTDYFNQFERLYTEWVECPSKFEKPEEASQTYIKPFKAGVVDGTFKNSRHRSWIEYQKQMRSRECQTIVQNEMFPKRRDFSTVVKPEVKSKSPLAR